MNIRKVFYTVVMLPLLVNFQLWAQEKAPPKNLRVNVGLLVATDNDKANYMAAIDQASNVHPHLTLDYIAADDRGYKREINTWLEHQIVDISFAPAGEMVCQMAREGRISSLQSFWESAGLDNRFSAQIKESVTCDDQVYALPFAYYYWGFFYSKATFKRLGLKPPKTWQELLTICRILKQSGVVPFATGTRNYWPSAAWLDYLVLRKYGLAFHQKMTAGDVPYTSDSIVHVLREWKHLVDQGYFLEDHQYMDWKQSMPFIYRGHAAMALAGAYVANQLPEQRRDELGFFAFPNLEPGVVGYENLPMETFVINRKSADKVGVWTLFEFLASPDTQATLAFSLGYFPATGQQPVDPAPVTARGLETVQSAKGFAQFFDREVPSNFAILSTRILAEFMVSANVEMTAKRLEQARQAIYSHAR